MSIQNLRAKIVLVLAVGCIALSACSGSSSDDDPDKDGASGTTDSGIVAEAKQAVDEARATPTIEGPKGAYTPKTDVTIGIVSCGQAATACNFITGKVGEAAKELGWKVSVADGELSAAGFAKAMERLIQEGVDGIVNVAVADAAIPNQLAKAKAAGIPVVCAVCGNKLSEPVKAPSIADVDPDYQMAGKALGDFVISESDGKAKVVILRADSYASAKARVDGAEEEIKRCEGCEVLLSENLTAGADQVATSRNQMRAILNRFPGDDGIDFVVLPSDTTGLGAVQALQALRPSVKAVSFDCDALNRSYIAKGNVEIACIDGQYHWSAWSAVDQLGRVLAGEEPAADAQVPFLLVDKSNVGDPKDPVPTSAFQDYYKQKVWGLK